MAVSNIGSRLAIRLQLSGCTNRQFFRIVVVPRWADRDSQPIEQIGSYDPMPNNQNEKLVAVNFDRLRYWISRNAMPSQPVLELLGLSGFFPIHPQTFMRSKRNRNAATANAEEVTPTPPAASDDATGKV